MSNVTQIQSEIVSQIKTVKRNAQKLSDVIQSLFVAIEAAKLDEADLKAVLITFVTETGDIRGVNCDRILMYTKACLTGGSISLDKNNAVKVRKHSDAESFEFTVPNESWTEFTKPKAEKKAMTISQADKKLSKLVTDITADLDNATAIALLEAQIQALRTVAPLRAVS